jgi:hypothetical protein
VRKDVREFIRWLAAVGLTVEATPGYYHVFREREAVAQGERDASHIAVLAGHDAMAQSCDPRFA